MTTTWAKVDTLLEGAAQGLIPSPYELQAIRPRHLAEWVEAAAEQLAAVADEDGPAAAMRMLRNNRPDIVAQLERAGVDPLDQLDGSDPTDAAFAAMTGQTRT